MGENVIESGLSCRSLDTSILDALALGGDVNGSGLEDFMLGGEPPNMGDAVGKLHPAPIDEQRDGAMPRESQRASAMHAHELSLL